MKGMQRISGGRFLLMGRAGMDFYADPPGAAAENASSFVAHLGGSSANVAVALSRQGLRSALLTTVSDDPVGRFCVNQLQRYGVRTDHVRVVTGEARTSLAVAESRLADYQCVIYRNDAADFHVAGPGCGGGRLRGLRRLRVHRHGTGGGAIALGRVPGRGTGAPERHSRHHGSRLSRLFLVFA